MVKIKYTNKNREKLNLEVAGRKRRNLEERGETLASFGNQK